MDDIIRFLQIDHFVPGDLVVIAVLIVLEGLLSCDNAVVLALLVKDLPPEQRGKALRYGIIGAYVFRITALALAVWIMSKWYLKVLGGAYLLWLAIRHFRHKDVDEHGREREVKPFFGLSAFWSTVIAVEMTDIVFSVDSIAAAVALSDKLYVLVIGGLLGILAMRYAAQGFVKLLEKFPRLESAAFIAVAVIGGKLLMEVPGDVLGRQHSFPEGTTYATKVEYVAMVEKHATPLVEVPHTLTINSAAAPSPSREVIQAGQERLFADRPPGPQRDHDIRHAVDHEYKQAASTWNLHYRPLIEIEGWLSSVIVLFIFVGGFFGTRNAKAATQPPAG